MRHLLTLGSLKPSEIEHVYQISADLKSKFATGLRESLLPGRVMALVFEKPSLRTRTSFEAAMIQLGGGAIFLGQEAGFGSRESTADFARVLSQYVDVIVARTYLHSTVDELAAHSECPVINGLSDRAHPCQALADLFTLREQVGDLKGHKLAFVGDGNNVARSLAVCCSKLGMRFHLACPAGYGLDPKFISSLTADVKGFELIETTDPLAAVKGALAVYTDVWTSMGQESESAKRKSDFAGYQVNAKLMAHAGKGAYFLHCLPAHRGEEVTDEVIDGPQSLVIEEAANRMHVQKGLLAWLLASQVGK